MCYRFAEVAENEEAKDDLDDQILKEHLLGIHPEESFPDHLHRGEAAMVQLRWTAVRTFSHRSVIHFINRSYINLFPRLVIRV
jgi:hypothetical protein